MSTTTSASPGIGKVDLKKNGAPSGKEVKEQLYATFTEALEKTKAEVRQMQEKLKEFDNKLEASATMKKQGEKATAVMKQTLDEIKLYLDKLTEKAKEVFEQAKEVTEEVVQELWKKLKESMEKLKILAIEFDEKYQVSEKVTQLIQPLMERLKVFQSSVDESMKTVKEMGKSGRSYIIGTAASLEHKYNFESKLNDLDQKYKISQTAQKLQEKGEEFLEKQHIKERVLELDEKWTGSKASAFVDQGVKIVREELGKVQQEYENAKSTPKEL